MDKQTEKLAIMTEWTHLKSQLEQIFHERDQKSAKIVMEKGITLVIQLLYVTNDEPYQPDQPIPYQQFSFMPVNMEERLGFIQSRPALYHSYRQLSELMVELEKLYVKRSIIKKTSRHMT